jgi:phage tail-like protein
MVDNVVPRIRFGDYLPEVFRTGGGAHAGQAAGEAADFLDRFLAAFEELFEELQQEVEGLPDGTGGLPDLFDPDLTPPPQFPHGQGGSFDYLGYLASWVGLALRSEKPDDWNRAYFRRALELSAERSTPGGLERLLRAWLRGDLLETNPPQLVLTDLTRASNAVDSIFQLDPDVPPVLGVQTVLGEGPPCFFVVDLVTDPVVRELRNPIGLDVLQRATRSLLDAEKPANSYYQLRIRASTMQLAPADEADAQPDELYAQLEDLTGEQPLLGTTLLWDEPLVFDSDRGGLID